MYHHSVPALLSHVLCLLLILLVRAAAGSQPATCSGEQAPPCMGDRPLLPTGCCPLGAGQRCRSSRGQSCDQELGLFCRDDSGRPVTEEEGSCTGEYKLRVHSRGETVVDLRWTAFAPVDYLFEYVALVREENYDPDIETWTIRELGSAPNGSLRHLQPATVHFIRVALWADARAGILGNITETIVVQTRPSEFCQHQGEFHLVGTQLIQDCEDNCTCLPTGQFECSPLCPLQGMPEVEEGCHVVPGDTCCDFKVLCPVAGESCTVDNASHPHGSEFEHDCQHCTCLHGEAECQIPVECEEIEPRPDCPNPEMVEVEGQCCPEWRCANQTNDTCVYEDQVYANQEYFTTETCGLCQCLGSDGVTCAPECPPVVMVMPDLACPDPHIRKDGCCDTLYCQDPNIQLDEFLGGIFAQSYSPVTMTLSFEVEPLTIEGEVPLFCEYAILFANTSDPLVTWHHRLVQPMDVRLRKDQVSSRYVTSPEAPIDLMTRDAAIVVRDRAYITLSGMEPDTNYYVRIYKLSVTLPGLMNEEPAGRGNYSGLHSAILVVRTMPMANVTSCFYEGREIHHGQLVRETCSEACSCSFGKVVCSSRCEAEKVVLARSPFCPQPRLERVEGQCCPEWMCYPSATGCLHRGLILSSGEAVSQGCDVCTCHNTSVTCVPQCPAPGPPPRPDCSLTNVTGHCCPQWKCPIDRHPPFGVRSSIVLHLAGTCPQQVSSFSQDLERQLLIEVTSLCLESLPGILNHCRNLQAEVHCPSTDVASFNGRWKRSADSIPTTAASAKKDSTGKIKVQIFLFANFSSESPDDLTVELLQSAGLALAGKLNRSLQVVSPDGEVINTTRVAPASQVSYLCGAGFTLVRGQCVLSEIESSVDSRMSTRMSVVDVTDSLVVLTWDQFSSRILERIRDLKVEHRQRGQLEWMSSAALAPTHTTYLLQSLTPGQNYTVRLVATTIWPDQGHWVMAELRIRTLQQRKVANTTRVTVTEVTVLPDNALVAWETFPAEVADDILDVEVIWKQAHEKTFKYRQKARGAHQSYARIPGLSQDSAYTAEVIVFLSSGTSIRSGGIHFVTKTYESNPSELLIAVVVSCAVSFLAGALFVAAVVWWKRGKERIGAGGFVNETYGIQVTNNTKDVAAAANPGVI